MWSRKRLLFAMVAVLALTAVVGMVRLGTVAVQQQAMFVATPPPNGGTRQPAVISVQGKPQRTAHPNPHAGHTSNDAKPALSSSPSVGKQRKGGRDGVDHSHIGLSPDPLDGMLHAWPVGSEQACHGASPSDDCIDPKAVDWFRDNVLLAIVTGAEGAFRVEVSQCTWLSHFPVENVFVFSDRVPVVAGHNRTPHAWIAGVLPKDVHEANGDIFSPSVKEGYVKVVRRRGQGYSASWIVAQFRFSQAVEHLFATAAARRKSDGKAYKWFMIGDDDTIIQLSNLVRRLRDVDATKPYYFSRKGWGGAGHIYSRAALDKLMAVMPQCVDKYFVKSFRASDDMLLKCAGMAKLHNQMETTMSHCPASHLGPSALLSPQSATFHGKKDFYPPILLTTWRVSLYYYASYCKSPKAAELAAYYSACAFGSCKQHGCTKEKNAAMVHKWHLLSRNNTLLELPFLEQGVSTSLHGASSAP